MGVPVCISSAVEGIVDEAIVRRLIRHVGGEPGPVYGKNGKPDLRRRIKGFNNAAQHAPWIVLVDLDRDADCAPPLRNDWLDRPAAQLCFRVAVREVEAWLLADGETLARFLAAPLRRIPANPEIVEKPKEALVNLARVSRNRGLMEDMVPRAGSGRIVGPAYTARLIEYVETHWRPNVAEQHAESLRRAIACMRGLVNRAQGSS